MPLAITLTPGKVFQQDEDADNAKLNQLGNPTVAVAGQANTAQIADGAVTPAKTSPGAYFWGTDAGTANAHAVTLSGTALVAYSTGLVIAYLVNVTNTAAVTVNVSAVGAKSIKLVTGQDPKPGDLRAGQIVELRYDGTNFELLTPAGNDNERMVTDTGSANAYVATYGGSTGWPTVTALKTGVRAAFKASFANTTACTFAPDGLTAQAIRKNGDVALVEGDIVAGQMVQVIYDEAANSAAGAWLMISPTVQPAAAVLIGQSVNLLIVPNAGTPLSKVDITADAVTLKTASGLAYMPENVSVTVDLAAAGNGVNKLDTGSEAAGTWYYLWLISDGTTTAGLISASSTAPTLPTNYGYRALVGVFRNSGATAEGALSGDIVPFRQQGRRLWVRDINLFTGLNAASLTVYQSISGTGSKAVQLSVLVPPIAKVVHGTAGSDNGHASITVAADANGLGAVTVAAYYTGADINEFNAAGAFTVPLATAQDFYWKSILVGSGQNQRINVNGYEL